MQDSTLSWWLWSCLPLGHRGSLLVERIQPLFQCRLQGPVSLQTNEETQAYARTATLTVKNNRAALFGHIVEQQQVENWEMLVHLDYYLIVESLTMLIYIYIESLSVRWCCSLWIILGPALQHNTCFVMEIDNNECVINSWDRCWAEIRCSLTAVTLLCWTTEQWKSKKY